jgi:hypothetical protein
LTLQRQARELGRLRAGLTATATRNGREITYPTSSKTWILTTHQRDYLEVAAELWGGTVEEWEPQGGGPKAWRLITEAEAIDAILPPGDPLSQHYELWSKGGCQRRCDGETELSSGKPCVCLAAFGPDFHQQKQGTVCDIHSRLNVILPDLPDIGVWRAETKGYWAANRIAAAVDLIKAQVGPQALIPVRLRIEPKKRVKDGRTSLFTEIVLEIRGGITFGQILSGRVPAMAAVGAADRPAIGDAERPAITAGPAVNGNNGNSGGAGGERLTAEQALKFIAACINQQQLEMVKEDCQRANLRDKAVLDAWRAKSQELANQKAAQANQAELAQVQQDAAALTAAVDAEAEPDADLVWMQINGYAGKHGWNAEELEQRVIAHLGKPSSDANGFELARFLEALQKGQVK